MVRGMNATTLKYASFVIAGIAVLVIIAGLAGLVQIGEGEVGVHTDQGAATGDVYEPDWYWVNPVTQDVEVIETRPVTVDMEDDEDIRVITEDGQDVFVEATVRYTVDDPVEMFSEYKNHDQAQERLIYPTVRSEMRHEASSISARDIISQDGRMSLEETALESLRDSASGGVSIDDVQVRNVELNEQFSSELEQIEVENARAEQRVIEAEGEANATRVEAEGDADAMEIRNEEITDEILALEQIGAYDDGTVFVTDGEAPVILEPNGTDSGNESSLGSGLSEDGSGLDSNVSEDGNQSESMRSPVEVAP